jgi:hypothetical protein
MAPRDISLSDLPPEWREPDDPDRERDGVVGLLQFIIDHLVPVLLTVALNLAPRLGYFRLIPLPGNLEQAFGNFALILGAAAALVASVTFSRAETPFDIPAFMGTAVAALITLTPFILERAGSTFGLPLRYFNVVATLSYLGFFLVVGLLVGGCWSVAVKAVRGAHRRYSPGVRDD